MSIQFNENYVPIDFNVVNMEKVAAFLEKRADRTAFRLTISDVIDALIAVEKQAVSVGDAIRCQEILVASGWWNE
jgi:hypothetical protein